MIVYWLFMVSLPLDNYSAFDFWWLNRLTMVRNAPIFYDLDEIPPANYLL
jgi:hypothetical protein